MIKQIRNKEVLKDVTKSSGEFVSSRKISLGAILGDEVITKRIAHAPESTTYSLLNHFYYNNRIITFTYLVVSKSRSHAFAVFNRYTDMFRRLIKRTEINKM